MFNSKKKSRTSYFRHLKSHRDRLLAFVNNSENVSKISQRPTCSRETDESDSDCSLLNVHNIIDNSSFDLLLDESNTNIHQLTAEQDLHDTPRTECDESDNINLKLRKWSLLHNIDHSALGGLLKILKPHFKSLPSDARTLLCTPRQIIMKTINPGQYCHFGLERAVRFMLDHTSRNNITNCEVCVNIDGLPLSKSSGSQFYPILISLYPVDSLICTVGIYHGNEKPQNPNEFLRDFVDEAVKLTENGIIFKNQTVPFKIKGFICDAPAKSFIKLTKSHTGYFSCSKCCQEGEFINNRVCFPNINYRERSDSDFLMKVQEEHHTGSTILQEIPNLGLVSSFPLDYMHLLCLGVMKKMIVSLWMCGKPPHKLSFQQIKEISDSLKMQSPNIPVEFCRKPRSLDEAKRWKATEFRQFLLYTGPVVLKCILDKTKYVHFLSLHVAVRILTSNQISEEVINYANSLMTFFVKKFATIYGKEFTSHNIHNLLHISKDVLSFGPLDNFSAFPFENYMQSIKKYIRKSEKPLAQVSKRITEAEIYFLMKQVTSNKNQPFKEHQTGPLIEGCQDPQFSEYHFEKFKVKTKHPDNCCKLKDGSIICVENFASINGNIVVIGRKFQYVNDFFSTPCNSSNILVFEVQNLGRLMFWSINEIDTKFVRLTLKESHIVLPLLHLES